MKRIQTCIALTIVILGLNLSSCSDNEDDIDWNGVEVTNTELKTILQQKGFTFNEAGKLVQDDKVKSTTTLDLSNSGLSDVSGLEVFPNLTDINLSDNKFSYSFDFSKLPATITNVDLTGNEIYEYPGLVNIETAENGDETVTVQRTLTRLLLPESARYNCVEIPTFFANSKGTDMQIENAEGTLATYTTQREVPDENLRNYLKETFPSIFEGDNIDIAKRIINQSEAIKSIVINDETENNSIEGVEYIVMHPSYKGGSIELKAQNQSQLPYLKITPQIYKALIKNINTSFLNLKEATNLCQFNVEYNSNIKEIDLSATTKMGQRGAKNEFNGTDSPGTIDIHDCPQLSSIIFPEKAKYLSGLKLYKLPLITKIDLSQFSKFITIILGGLDGLKELSYFDIDDAKLTNGIDFNPTFAIEETIYNFKVTKDFLDTYHSKLSSGYLTGTGLTTYRWWKNYQ